MALLAGSDVQDQTNNREAGQPQGEKPEEKQAQNQTGQGQSPEQQKSEPGKEAQKQAGQEKSGQSDAEKKEAQATQSAQSEAEKKEAQTGQTEAQKQAMQEKPGQPGDKQAGGDAGAPQQQGERVLTVKDLKKQEAEKILRSVDDRIGTYILTPEQANTEGKSRNGKDW